MEKKLSEKFWDKHQEDPIYSPYLSVEHKEKYDKILSLEAKIEELERLLNLKETKIEPRYALEIRLGVCRKDLQQIAKDENL